MTWARGALSCADTPLKSRVCKRDTGRGRAPSHRGLERGARQRWRRAGGVLGGLTHEKRPGEFEKGRNTLWDVRLLWTNSQVWDGPQQGQPTTAKSRWLCAFVNKVLSEHTHASGCFGVTMAGSSSLPEPLQAIWLQAPKYLLSTPLKGQSAGPEMKIRLPFSGSLSAAGCCFLETCFAQRPPAALGCSRAAA